MIVFVTLILLFTYIYTYTVNIINIPIMKTKYDLPIDLTKLSDEELLEIVDESQKEFYDENSVVRVLSKQFFDNDSLIQMLSVRMILLPEVAKRLK